MTVLKWRWYVKQFIILIPLHVSVSFDHHQVSYQHTNNSSKTPKTANKRNNHKKYHHMNKVKTMPRLHTMKHRNLFNQYAKISMSRVNTTSQQFFLFLDYKTIQPSTPNILHYFMKTYNTHKKLEHEDTQNLSTSCQL
jgi:hypothetical protein